MTAGSLKPATIMVTGGAGFIGSAVIRRLIAVTDATIVNVDKLTYAGNLESLASVANDSRYHFEQVDICDPEAINRLFVEYRPDAIMHLAAETHVDRSIEGPGVFIQTNVVGTFNVLDAARAHFSTLGPKQKAAFRFHHISTDEVFGSLGDTGRFTETSPYRPSSPYAASKASSDHLVRAWHQTFGLPVVLTNCSNNYGPYQFPEKLIPVLIRKALSGAPLPIYGRGLNVRDWLFVDDHAAALVKVLLEGTIGETYNIGGNEERSNVEIARAVCGLLDDLVPQSDHVPHASLIEFTPDRPGHDLRYAMDLSKISKELGWTPSVTLKAGLRTTVNWYLNNADWCDRAVARTQEAESRLPKTGVA